MPAEYLDPSVKLHFNKYFASPIELVGAAGVTIRLCEFESLLLQDCRDCKIELCFARPISSTRNPLQINRCQNISVSFFCSRVLQGPTEIEDIVSVCESDRVTIEDSWLEGNRPDLPERLASGSAGMVDYKCSRVVFQRCYGVDVHNCGFGISDGVDNAIRGCCVYSEKGGGEGDVGIYVGQAEEYRRAGNIFKGNAAEDNLVYWTMRGGMRNDWWLDGAAVAARNKSLPASAASGCVRKWWKIWTKRRDEAVRRMPPV